MRFAFLALFAGFFSCQTATQITVKLRGVGVSCPSGDAPTIEQTGVLAKRQLQSAADMSELSVLGEECNPAEESVVSLGDIVLVPADGPGPVEVLALGALKVGDEPAVSAEECRAEYERLFGAPCEIGEGKPCESCIFARRSVAFVKHSKLEITIDLEASCAGVICDPSQTCSKGVCVSAAADCADDGSCVLDNEPKGGAGAGGAGGAGGTGGEGGGSIPDVWDTLWQPGNPATTSCPGASPSDVIAGAIGPATVFTVLAAAGPCMLMLQSGQPPVAYGSAQVSGSNLYKAVAQGANGNFLALGDAGWSQLSGAQPFSSIAVPQGLFDPSDEGSSWDIAVYDSPNQRVWARGYPDGSADIDQFPPDGPQNPLRGPALFAVFPSQGPTQPFTFAAYGPVLASRAGMTTSTVTSAANSPNGWSLWAAELANDPGTFVIVPVGASTDAVSLGSCSDPSGGKDPSCNIGAQSFNPVASSGSPRKVVAIWGLQHSSGIELYAVGQDDSRSPWLGRAALPGPGNPAATTGWTFAGLPQSMLTGTLAGVSSVWVGRSGSKDAVVVAGRAGVFKADIDDLVFSSAP